MASHMGMSQNLVPLVNIKIAGKWMFIPLKMVLIGIDPYPYDNHITESLDMFIFVGLAKRLASFGARKKMLKSVQE